MDVYRLIWVVYWVVLAALTALVWLRGGRPEREGAAVAVIGSFLTPAAVSLASNGYGSAQLGILSVDLAMLAAFLFILLRYDRFWPIWASGFHLVGVATHLAKLSFPDILPQAYWTVQGMWAYPIMLAIAAGTLPSTVPRESARA